jgi:LPS sulfotransferase NodH
VVNNKVVEAFPENPRISRAFIQELTGKSQLYLIFLVARSGSTWLMELAENSGVLGTPQEWFNEGWIHTEELALGCRPPKVVGTCDVERYIERTVKDYQSPYGAMGAQLSIYQAQCLCEMLEDPAHAARSFTPFYLRRRDIVTQAISLYRSVRSGLFHSYQSNPDLRSRFDLVAYDSEAIMQWCEHLVANELAFEKMFSNHGIRPSRFTYEDIVLKPADVLNWMAEKIGVHTTEALSARSDKLTILANKTSEEWSRRFKTEKAEYLSDLHARRPVMRSELA